MNKSSYRIALISYMLLGFFIAPAMSLAYEKTTLPNIEVMNDFVVEPGKTELFLDPGQKAVKNISVTNRVNRTVKFRLSTEDFVGTNDSAQPVILMGDEHSPYSLKDLIVPEITEFSLEFGEKITIPVNVSVPLDAEPRGYYGALIISNDPDKLSEENTLGAQGKTRIVSRIGSLFLIRINGEGMEEGELESFKVAGPAKLFYSRRPEGFEIAFKNTGNVHLVPYGTITVTNIFNKVVDVLPVDAYFSLPEATRYREVEWQNGLSLGRYTATLSLYKGYGEEYAEAEISFWIIPWKILIPVFVALLLIVSLTYYVLTRFELRKK